MTERVGLHSDQARGGTRGHFGDFTECSLAIPGWLIEHRGLSEDFGGR